MMNEPLISREQELQHLYARLNYMEWILARHRQYAREELGADDTKFNAWLAVQTAIQGIPQTADTLKETQDEH